MTERGASSFDAAQAQGEGRAHHAGRIATSDRAMPAPVALLTLAMLALVASVAQAQVYSFRDRGGTQHFTNVPTDARYKAMPMPHANVGRISFTPRSRATTEQRTIRLARAEHLWNEPPADLGKLIDQTAQRYGVETALVHAVVRAESAFDHLAVSSAGAQGLMQLMPATASEVGVRDAFHPQQNLEGGVFYLRQLIERFNGNLQLAIAGYNAGPGAVERFGGVPPFAETLEYVERVFRFRQEYLLSRRMDRQRVVVASR